MAAEKRFEKKVKEFLTENDAWFIKYWGGGGFTKSGIPDLLVCHDGMFLGIELKADKGEPSLLQLHNLKRIRAAGGYGILLYPKDWQEFKVFLYKKSQNNSWYLNNILEQIQWRRKVEE